MAAPLAVDAGVKVPHSVAGVQDQLTPALLGSPLTLAVMLVLLSISTEAGGVELNATVILEPIVMVAETDALESADVAVTVTLAPLGTDVGAV